MKLPFCFYDVNLSALLPPELTWSINKKHNKTYRFVGLLEFQTDVQLLELYGYLYSAQTAARFKMKGVIFEFPYSDFTPHPKTSPSSLNENLICYHTFSCGSARKTPCLFMNKNNKLSGRTGSVKQNKKFQWFSRYQEETLGDMSSNSSS